MKKKGYRRCFYLVLIALFVPFYGCGGGGDSTIVPTTTLDVEALWTVTEISGANTCESPVGVQSSYDIFVKQVGTIMTVYTPAGTFTGSIVGDTFSWTGSYPEDGGTTTITAMNLTVNPTADSLSGSVDWAWSDGVFSCSGVIDMSATKQVTPPPPAAPLDVAGTWAVSDTVGKNTCGDPVSVENYDIIISQTGTDITVVTPAGTFNGTVTDNIMEWTGSHLDQGGTTTMTLMYLIVNDNATSFSGPVFWTWTDGVFPCAGVSDTTGSK